MNPPNLTNKHPSEKHRWIKHKEFIEKNGFFWINEDDPESSYKLIEESDLILFVVDVREGLLPFDKTIADYIRTTKKKMWLLINKFDSDKQWGDEADFYELGLKEDDFMIISAEHNRGLQDLKDRLSKATSFTFFSTKDTRYEFFSLPKLIDKYSASFLM